MKNRYWTLFIATVSVMSSCVSNSETDKTSHIDNHEDVVEVEPSKSDINISGKWTSKDNGLYPILEFKGKSTVVIGTILGPYVTEYVRDEEFIRVSTDKSDLLFEVVSEDSIVGSGFAKGTWIKDK